MAPSGRRNYFARELIWSRAGNQSFPEGNSKAAHGKPWLHISYAGSYERPGEQLAAFVRENNIKTLNVAGSRGSKELKVAAFVKLALEEAFYPRAEAMVLRG